MMDWEVMSEESDIGQRYVDRLRERLTDLARQRDELVEALRKIVNDPCGRHCDIARQVLASYKKEALGTEGK